MAKVSLPVFDGLFPNHDKQIQDLLFDLNAFHSFAKFRIHSDPSLDILDSHTTALGKSLRTFQKKKVAIHYETSELPKEVNARQKRKTAQKTKASGSKSKGKRKATDDNDATPVVPRRKLFNLCTWKIHALGYYVKFICLFGTTDSYTTQTVGFL